MLVVSWNIRANTGAAPDRLKAIAACLASVTPDLVLLQEVGSQVTGPLDQELKRLGWNTFSGGLGEDPGKPYGNMLASRWPLSGVAPGWAAKAPWPHLLTRATVTVDGQGIDAITAHIPNGRGNGWKKIETFEALAEALATSPPGPRILGGDFNEPRLFRPDGDLVSFGAKELADGSYSLEGELRAPRGRSTPPPESHPRRRWDDAVKSILGPGAPHGLRHAFHLAHGLGLNPATHVTRGGSRFFDHLLVSGAFTVGGAGFHDEWRTNGPSDHAAAWASVRLSGALPGSNQRGGSRWSRAPGVRWWVTGARPSPPGPYLPFAHATRRTRRAALSKLASSSRHPGSSACSRWNRQRQPSRATFQGSRCISVLSARRRNTPTSQASVRSSGATRSR